MSELPAYLECDCSYTNRCRARTASPEYDDQGIDFDCRTIGSGQMRLISAVVKKV